MLLDPDGLDSANLDWLPQSLLEALATTISELWPVRHSMPLQLWLQSRHLLKPRLRTFRRLVLSDTAELLSMQAMSSSPPILVDLDGLAFTDDELGQLHALIGARCEALRLDRTDVTIRGLTALAMACSGERRPFSQLKVLSLRELKSVDDQMVQRLVSVLPSLAMLGA